MRNHRSAALHHSHLGQLWPTKNGVTIDADGVVQALVLLMEEGDVLTHPFVSAATGEIHPVV